MEIEELSGRKVIIDAALRIFVEQRDSFTIKRISERAGISTDDVRVFYPNKSAILKDFFSIIPDLYKVQSLDIEGFSALPLADKLSNYIYTSFDILQEHRDFVEMTFSLQDMGRNSTSWKEKSVKQFMDFVDLDSRIPDLNRVVIPDFLYSIAINEYFEIIQFWLKDESQGSEKSLALVDKLTSFIQEVMYSGVPDKGFDLIKYVVGQGIWKSRLPNFRLHDLFCNDITSDTSECFKQTTDFFNSISNKFCADFTSGKSTSDNTKSTETPGIQIQVN